ncbi:unnamed protein product, partial [Urochloa humidicola]
ESRLQTPERRAAFFLAAGAATPRVPFLPVAAQALCRPILAAAAFSSCSCPPPLPPPPPVHAVPARRRCRRLLLFMPAAAAAQEKPPPGEARCHGAARHGPRRARRPASAVAGRALWASASASCCGTSAAWQFLRGDHCRGSVCDGDGSMDGSIEIHVADFFTVP